MNKISTAIALSLVASFFTACPGKDKTDNTPLFLGAIFLNQGGNNGVQNFGAFDGRCTIPASGCMNVFGFGATASTTCTTSGGTYTAGTKCSTTNSNSSCVISDGSTLTQEMVNYNPTPAWDQQTCSTLLAQMGAPASWTSKLEIPYVAN